MNTAMTGVGWEAAKKIGHDPSCAEDVLKELGQVIQQNAQASLLFIDIEALWVVVGSQRPELLDLTTATLVQLADSKQSLFRILKLMEQHNSPQATAAVLKVAPNIPGVLDHDYLIEAGVVHYMLGKPWLLEALIEEGLAHDICARANTDVMRVVTEELLNGKFPLDKDVGVQMVEYLLNKGCNTLVPVPGWTQENEVRGYRCPMDKVCDLIERDENDRAKGVLDILAGAGVPLEAWEQDQGIVGEHLEKSALWRRRRLSELSKPNTQEHRNKPRM